MSNIFETPVKVFLLSRSQQLFNTVIYVQQFWDPC
jgi:hypothetical protein